MLQNIVLGEQVQQARGAHASQRSVWKRLDIPAVTCTNRGKCRVPLCPVRRRKHQLLIRKRCCERAGDVRAGCADCQPIALACAHMLSHAAAGLMFQLVGSKQESMLEHFIGQPAHANSAVRVAHTGRPCSA
jgi:hypothetical protein